MREHEARALARTLMRDHLVSGVTDGDHWTFRFDHARRRFGQCDYLHKIISLSRPLTLCNDEPEVRDTLLHEIAHALAGAEAGHGAKWKLAARRLGARPERCYDSTGVTVPKPNYFAVCPECLRLFTRFKRIRSRRLCAACRKFLTFNIVPNTWPILRIETPHGVLEHDTRTGDVLRRPPPPEPKPRLVQGTLF